jgi:hypothetical protein
LVDGDITIRYDKNILSIVDVKMTDLISGMNVSINKETAGIISVSFAGAKGLTSGRGALMDITFKIDANAKYGTETALELIEVKIYDESAKSIPVSLENGKIKVIGIKGDINGDGEVKANDAILALRISSGLMKPDDYQLWAGDMNDDGAIKANDAILILRKSAGLAPPSKVMLANSGKVIKVRLSDAGGISGEEVIVALMVDDIDNLSGGDIVISYDGSVLKAVEVSSVQDILLVSNITDTGEIHISFASIEGLREKVLANIRFNVVSDDKTSLSLRTVNLYGRDGNLLVSKVIAGKFESYYSVPTESQLLQNYPNPFNPETWIPYQLKEGGEVKLSIYNVSGELVREISLGHKPAGKYVSKERAIYWDGRNGAGERVSSGIYFYTITCGNSSETRKMVISK